MNHQEASQFLVDQGFQPGTIELKTFYSVDRQKALLFKRGQIYVRLQKVDSGQPYQVTCWFIKKANVPHIIEDCWYQLGYFKRCLAPEKRDDDVFREKLEDICQMLK